MAYIVRTRDDIILDGVSARSVGLIIEIVPPVPMAVQRYSQWQTGLDSDFVEPDDSFEDVVYTLTARKLLSPDDFRGGSIYALLANAKKLQLTRNPGRYYRINRLNGAEPSANAVYRGNEVVYRITFSLAPFAYYTENTPVTMGLDPVITNPGTRYSRPVYKITHNGACQLVVNNQHLKIYSTAPSPIFIDAERMFAYSATNQNATADTEGLFPFLEAGENTVYTTGDSTLEITGNWRDY